MSELDPKALEAAASALEAMYHGDSDNEPFFAMAKRVVTTYLASSQPSEAGESSNTTTQDEVLTWPEREEGVTELVDSWRKFISDRPQLTSFLYDVDLLPEQIVSRTAAHCLDAICCVYTAAEEGQIALRAKPAPAVGSEL